MAAATTVAADTQRANGSALLSVATALAMSVAAFAMSVSMTGCMHGATTVQPTLEPTTMAVGAIETTAATAPGARTDDGCAGARQRREGARRGSAGGRR